MLLHEVADGGSGVRLQVADGFAEKRPAHVSGRQVVAVLFSLEEYEEEKQSKDGGKKQDNMLQGWHGD